MDRKMELGKMIRSMRQARNLTQGDLAKAIGQSQSSITMYETGRREPDYDTLKAMAKFFEVPFQTFFAADDLKANDIEKIMQSIHLPDEMDQEIVRLYHDLPTHKKQQVLDYIQFLKSR